MTSMLKELRERIEDDFHSMILISLSGQDAELYAQPDKGWERLSVGSEEFDTMSKNARSALRLDATPPLYFM
jgi:DNA-binding transcriptional regulator/RsmH inhibitor MraZ